jgi:fumarylacetoacetase
MALRSPVKSPLKSWLASANDPDTEFPLDNLPYGVFRRAGKTRIGVAIGDRILDLRGCAESGLFAGLGIEIVEACSEERLNRLMALGGEAWHTLRREITALLVETADNSTRRDVDPLIVPMREVEMRLPAAIGDYTDFYASIHHATRVGRRFRPDNPLMPNYKYVPVGYHGRASSIVVSGSQIRRPCGQTKSASDLEPVFGPSKSVDYELEMGVFIGPGNARGQPISIAEANRQIFGLCLVNDWSARDIQAWEYQPLGPFLAKNFATAISPWIVPLEALEPYRMAQKPRPAGDPAPLAYLASEELTSFDVTLEVWLDSARMRAAGQTPMLASRGNLRDLYWTIDQLVTHHASNGCNLQPGDLLATGTISGAEEGSEGCLLEKLNLDKLPDGEALRLPNGETRRFLENGDRVILRGYAAREGLPRIGFGECVGTVV